MKKMKNKTLTNDRSESNWAVGTSSAWGNVLCKDKDNMEVENLKDDVDLSNICLKAGVEKNSMEVENAENKSVDGMDELSQKLPNSFIKILENREAKDDFLEDGIDPEASRNFVRKGGKLRKGAGKNSNIINVPIMFSNPKMKKRRFMEETSAMGNDGDPYWLEYPEIKDIIKEFWEKQNESGRSIFGKMNLLKLILSEWSRDKVGDIEKKLKDTEKKLALLEKKEEQDTLSENELMLRRSLLNKRTALGRQRQIKWWSRSRKNWIEGGEKNTRYYHNVVKLRRQVNLVEELEVENRIVKDSNEMAGHTAKWYENLWKREENNSSDFNTGN
ncbi:hypothetical protein Cni_G20686 [Canna indica]|uniref:Uncharacterized protein n=1 Tax=Canna indica TaxID=4628 RepID=A0AAQ3KN47_9LILI|nr:hypothetical protein Cni_G20686 [Canna indica]